MLIAALAMVPLFAAAAMLFRYESVASTASELARRLMQECSIRGEDCVAQAQTASERWQHHLFSQADAPIESLSSGLAPQRIGLPYWVDSQARALVPAADAIAVSVKSDQLDAGEAVAVSRTRDAAERMQRAGPARFGLQPREGLLVVNTTVDARFGDVRPWLGLGLATLRFNARAATVADAWNVSAIVGSQPSSFESRFDLGRHPIELLPRRDDDVTAGSQDQPDFQYWQTRAWLEIARARGFEPSAGEFRFGEIDLRRLPQDPSVPRP